MRVGGIEATIAVGFEVVAIDLGCERLGGDSPDASRVFFHGDGFGDAVEGERDPGGGGNFIGEGDAAVGMDLSGMEMRGGLGGERKRRGERKEQREFAGGAGREDIHMRQFS